MNKLYKSKTDKVISGLFGGISEYLNIDSTLIRIMAVLIFLSRPFTFLLFYIIATVIVPEDDGIIINDNKEYESSNTPLFLGGGLIIFGSILLAERFLPSFHFNIFSSLRFILARITNLWPVLLIVLGIYIITNRNNK